MGILVFILTISFLILVHELGHFSVARLFGVRVEEFAFGFPPRLWSKKIGDTLYSINLFPIGGFTKLYGEEGKHKKEKDSYSTKPWWQKFCIGIAGVFANFVFAALILAIGYNFGLPRMISDYSKVHGVAVKNQVVIVEAKEDLLASELGLKRGDVLLSIEGQKFADINEFKKLLANFRNQKVELKIKRTNEIKIYQTILPDKEEEILGVYLVENPIYKFGFLKSLWIGIRETVQLIVYIAVSIYFLVKNLIITGKVAEFAAGPVGIYYIASGVSKLGIIYILQFMALISINLGLINLLPIPALDGGRITFNLLEGIRGKALNPRIENTVHTIGFIFLIILIILIFYRDILRIPYYQSIFE